MSSRRHYFPPAYQDWLFAALELKSGAEVSAELITAVNAYNDAWVKAEGSVPGRGAAKGAGGGPRDRGRAPGITARRAYAAYYMTINMPKLWAMLDRAPTFLDALGPGAFGVTELGCGPGTFLWAFLFYLQARRPDVLQRLRTVTGVDDRESVLTGARALASRLQREPAFAHLRFEFRVSDWRAELQRPGELVIVGNVLGEGDPVPGWWGKLEAAALAVIEPGTLASFQQYVRPLRDGLLAAGWHAHFPCPQAHACPLTADNWCHFHVNRFMLPFVQRMSSRAGRLNPRHNYCGFLFARHTPSGLPAGAWRVLSTLRKQHRSGIRWVCDGACLIEAVLNRKSRAAANRPFLDVETGDAIAIGFAAGPDEFHRTGRFAAADTVTGLAGARTRPSADPAAAELPDPAAAELPDPAAGGDPSAADA